jgi:hypothetical protein
MSGRVLFSPQNLFVLITVVLRWRKAWSFDGIILIGENRIIRRNAWPGVALSTTNLTLTDP